MMAVSQVSGRVEPKQHWAVVPAAGTGSRFGGDTPKQWLSLLGQPLMVWSVNAFSALPLAGMVIVIHQDDAVSQNFDYQVPFPIYWVNGGASRAESVLAGLRFLSELAQPTDWIWVHDVARPCLHSDILQTTWEQLGQEAVGGLVAIPVRDTLKRQDLAVSSNVTTVDRTGLWQAQTPQVFPYRSLHDSLNASLRAGVTITDEAGAMEWAGHPVKLFSGRADNLKVTYAEDLSLAQAILQARQAGLMS